MPGRPPEKTRKSRRFGVQRYHSEPFRQATVKEGQKLEVVADDIGMSRSQSCQSYGIFAIAEKLVA